MKNVSSVAQHSAHLTFESCHKLLSHLMACGGGEVRRLLPLVPLSRFDEAHSKLSVGHFYLPVIFTLANPRSLMFHYLGIKHAFFFFLLVFSLLLTLAAIRLLPPIPLVSSRKSGTFCWGRLFSHLARFVFLRSLYKQADSALKQILSLALYSSTRGNRIHLIF